MPSTKIPNDETLKAIQDSIRNRQDIRHFKQTDHIKIPLTTRTIAKIENEKMKNQSFNDIFKEMEIRMKKASHCEAMKRF